MNKDSILSLVTIALTVAVVAGLLTLLHLGLFQAECSDNGGTFSIEGTSAHCRY